MLTYLFDCGPVLNTGSGMAPLTHQELQAWQHNTATPLTPWEARALRRLSQEYLGELIAAESPGRPPPWEGAEDVVKRVTAANLRSAIGDLAGM